MMQSLLNAWFDAPSHLKDIEDVRWRVVFEQIALAPKYHLVVCAASVMLEGELKPRATGSTRSITV
jgi:hypothetical protein